MDKTIPELALSFFKSVAAFASSGFKITPIKVIEERLLICHQCDQFEKKWFAGTGRCNECGCSIEAKVRMATNNCPINKWSAVQ